MAAGAQAGPAAADSLLLLAQDFPPQAGGIQTLTWEIYSRLGDLVRVAVAPSLPAGVDDAERNWLPLWRARHGIGGVGTLAYLVEAAAHLRRYRRQPCLLHCNHAVSGYAGWLLRQTNGMRYVVWAHGAELVNRRQRWVLRRSLAGASAILANSAHTAWHVRLLLGGRTPPLFQIPLGAPPQWLALPLRPQPEQGVPIVLTVSRLATMDRIKGVDTALRALGRLQRQGVAFEYVIVGDGDDRPRLQALAYTEGIGARTHFLGHVSEAQLLECYDRATVFLLCSREEQRPDGANFEGFGIVYLEAAARGLAAVAGRSGGVPDAVIDGVTGLLVDPNSPGAVAEAVARLLNDAPLRLQLGRQGRARVAAEYNWDHAATCVRRVHEQICFGEQYS